MSQPASAFNFAALGKALGDESARLRWGAATSPAAQSNLDKLYRRVVEEHNTLRKWQAAMHSVMQTKPFQFAKDEDGDVDYTRVRPPPPGAPAVSADVRVLQAYELKALEEAIEAQRETLEEAMGEYVLTKLQSV